MTPKQIKLLERLVERPIPIPEARKDRDLQSLKTLERYDYVRLVGENYRITLRGLAQLRA